MGVDNRTGVQPKSTRDSIAFAALTLFAVLVYTIPAEWIEAFSKLRLALLASITAAGLMAIRRLAKREAFYFDGPRGVALILFGLLAFVSKSWSVAPEVSSHHGVEILKLVAIYLTMVNVITTPRRLAVFAGAMVLSSIVTSYHVIQWHQAGVDLVEGYRARWLGVYADPNHMAMDIGIVIPMAVALLVHRTNPVWVRAAALLAAGLAVTAIVFSYSRGGFIGLVVAMTVWIFLERTRRMSTLLMGAVLALGLLLFAPKTFWERNQTLETIDEDASAMGRVYAWEVASRMSQDNPILGVGAGGFRYAWPLYAPHEAATAYVAHNVYLDVVGELGFLGLLLFLVFTGGAAGGAFTATRDREMGWLANGIAAAVVGYVVCDLFSGYTLSSHFYVMFGLAACADRIAAARARATAKAKVPASNEASPAIGGPMVEV